MGIVYSAYYVLYDTCDIYCRLGRFVFKLFEYVEMHPCVAVHSECVCMSLCVCVG